MECFSFICGNKKLSNILLLKSNENNTVVALVEIAGSHDECLLTQILALKHRNCDVVLVCTPEIRARNPFFEQYVDHYIELEFTKGTFGNLFLAKKMMRLIRQTGAEHVVFNTAQGGHVRNAVIWSVFSRLNFVGIIHTTRKFEGSFTQKIINWKVKRYLLLSQFLKEKVGDQKGMEIDFFYPIHFPTYPKVKKSDQQTITIIGGVENRRKDLEGFVEMIESVSDKVRFVFLGKSDKNNKEVAKFNELIREKGLKSEIIQFDAFVDPKEFDFYLQQSTAILPLVHPDTPSADQYFKNQISGAMNVAFAYKIPLLIHEAYQHIEEMKSSAIYYSLTDFGKVISASNFDEVKERMKSDPKLNLKTQENRYADFVLDSVK